MVMVVETVFYSPRKRQKTLCLCGHNHIKFLGCGLLQPGKSPLVRWVRLDQGRNKHHGNLKCQLPKINPKVFL
jgi:hypothetical protein